MITFYNKYGSPFAYSDDLENIYLFSGEPVAYISNDSIYSFSGEHLGWVLDGWIRDHRGDAIFFTENAKGGPLKPLKQLSPLKNIKRLKPLKHMREIKPLKPIKSFMWSPLSSEEFFKFNDES